MTQFVPGACPHPVRCMFAGRCLLYEDYDDDKVQAIVSLLREDLVIAKKIAREKEYDRGPGI